MKNAMFFIAAALLLIGCMAGTEPKSQKEQTVSVIINNDNQEKGQGTAKEDNAAEEIEIIEEREFSELELLFEEIKKQIENIENWEFPELEPLSEEIKKQIEEDYVTLKYPRGINIYDTRPVLTNYYGTYKGCIAFKIIDTMSGSSNGSYRESDILAGIVFNYRKTVNPVIIRVWKEGLFYELPEAYNAGLLDREDLKSIFYYFEAGKKAYPDLEPLNEEMKMQICNDYYNHIVTLNPSLANVPEARRDPILIRSYYGTYNNCVAVMFNGLAGDAGKIYIIGDVLFGYSNTRRIKIWNEGNFYELQEAFEAGLLNKDDLENIAYYFSWS